MHKPMSIPGITPSKKPNPIRNNEMLMWWNNSPDVSNSINVETIAVGGGKNLASISPL
jgi:hypothetical protein